jgi:spore coat protein H
MNPAACARPHLASTLLLLALVGCGSGSSADAADPDNDLSAGGGGNGGSDAVGFGPRDADELFSPETLPTFELSLPPERWQYLQAHARDEDYEPAELRFRGEVVGQVGLRFKGNVGTLSNCFDAEGNLTCRKLSMKVKLDEYEPELRFYGLKRFNLHSMIRDATLLHEKLTYDLYREVGVSAPRSSWAIATVNGVSLGLFSLVEEVDGRFTKDRWLEDGDGNLYKEAWPRSTAPEEYAAAIETNEDTATHEAFATFAGDLAAATDAASRRRALGRWMDLEELARYMAVDDAIANIDGATAIYCRPDEPAACGNHNYFFYLSEDEARFRLVPWDLDATLWPQTIYDNVPPWQVTPDACDERYAIDSDDTVLAAPGCDPLFSGLAHDLTDYDTALADLVAGPFSVAAAEAAIDRHAAFIADAVALEPGGQSVERWQSELAVMKGNIPHLHARAYARRQGYTATALELSSTAVNDFETLDPVALALLPSLSNPSTTTTMTLAGAASSVESALEGSQSLLLSFEYRNEGLTPWSQWTNLALPFRGRPVDLSERTGVRLTLRTDSPRTVRVDLDSRLYEASNEGIKFGWDIPASEEPLTAELKFAEAALPAWARATQDDLAVVRTRVDGLAFHPLCNDREERGGLLADGGTDDGFLELDAIELF